MKAYIQTEIKILKNDLKNENNFKINNEYDSTIKVEFEVLKSNKLKEGDN
jgi:hypothetical protein